MFEDNEDLTEYVNWKKLKTDFNLKYGDISPVQYLKLKELLEEFIVQNRES